MMTTLVRRPFTIVDIPITPYSLSCGVEQDARSLTGSLQHNNHAPHIHTAEQKEREVQLEGQTDTNNKTNLNQQFISLGEKWQKLVEVQRTNQANK